MIINYFDYYTNKLGWQVIPISPNSKSPFSKNWNKDYDQEKCRQLLEENPDSNLGLLLGNIIDLEADSEKANILLSNLTKKTDHPQYKSQKSIHHLFLTPDPYLTRITIHGIEFRGKHHQSLLPPSKNSEGIIYEWISYGKIPPLPDSLLNLYNKHKKMMLATEDWAVPTCYICHKKSRPINKKRFILEKKAFYERGLYWQCHKCREVDIRNQCREIRSR